jgi:hypothetical protein
MFRDSPNNNEGIISVLQDRARQIIDKRVKKEATSGGVQDKLL